MKDDYLQLGQQFEMEFVQIENFFAYDQQYNAKDSYIASIFIRYD